MIPRPSSASTPGADRRLRRTLNRARSIGAATIDVAAIEVLLAHGLSATVPRRAVLELFRAQPGLHVRPDAVIDAIAQRLLDSGTPAQPLSLTTVYRVLSEFCEAGLLTRSCAESGRPVYELRDTSAHGHLVCVRCGHLELFDDPALAALHLAAAKTRGFRIREGGFSLYGLCGRAECRTRWTGVA